MRSSLAVVPLSVVGLFCLTSDSAHAQIIVDLPPGALEPEPPISVPPLPPLAPPAYCSTRLCGAQHWDFEPTSTITSSSVGDLQGWTGTYNAGLLGPSSLTAGSNVVVSRVLAAPASGTIPPGHEQIASMRSLPSLGGNYWDSPYHTGYQGTFWLGSFDTRPRLRTEVGQGNEARRMDVTSPEFSIDSFRTRYIHFLAGGGCDSNVYVALEQRVYRRPGIIGCTKAENDLAAAEAAMRAACSSGGSPINCIPAQNDVATARAALDACRAATGGATGTVEIADPVWEPASIPFTNPLTHETTVSTPFKHTRNGRNCSEAMSRVTWDVQELVSRPEEAGYRLRVVDGSASAHISVDDFWVTMNPTVPEPKVPVWGVADLHAHLMNEKGTMAFNDSAGSVPASRGLWGSASVPVEQLDRCNDTHTTNNWNFNSHQDEVFGTTYTLSRDLTLNMVDGAGRNHVLEGVRRSDFHSTHGGSGANWADWPLWSSAIHQQMHSTWVRRAYDGGLRLMVATVGNAESIGFALAKEQYHAFMSDQDALALQIPAIFDFALQNSSWVEVALTPQHARQIIRSGKMALVIGAELDHIMDNCGSDVLSQHHHTAAPWSSVASWAAVRGFNADVIGEGGLGVLGSFSSTFGDQLGTASVMHIPDHPRTCTEPEIQARLDALYRAGVRQIIPMHFADNMLGGYALTNALFTTNSIFGSPDALAPTFLRPGKEPGQAESLGIDLTTFETDLGNLINVPAWLRVSPDHILRMSDRLPPGGGRVVLDFVSGECIDDDGWRAVAAFFTLGASEVHCAASELTELLSNLAHDIVPWEGLVDTAAVAGLGFRPADHAGPGQALPSHVNALGLKNEGTIFVREMMRRGMLVDLQHASEHAKNDIVAMAGNYPLMSSHGGVETHSDAVRHNENTLSTAHFHRVYQRSAPGIVGTGTQSAEGFRDQLRSIGNGLQDPDLRQIGVALGTDMNGFDWHSFPRFGNDAFFPERPDQREDRAREGRVGPMVNYAPYDASTTFRSALPDAGCNGCTWPRTLAGGPPLTPHGIVQGGRVVRTFNINFDGYAHYGMTPDFLQEVAALGATRDEMAPVFRSAESTLRMWEETCRQAYQMSGAPTSITQGCGPEEDYQ